MEHGGRSSLLEALCILSFIGNGLAILALLSAAIWNHAAREWIKDWSSANDVTGFNTGYFLIFALLYVMSLTGVLRMWKVRKSGFYLYVISQTGIMVFPSVWSGEMVFSSVVVIFTVLFILLYAREMFRNRVYSLDP